MSSPMHPKIEDYALIGDCETAALISNHGSIDWLCWPRFDSGACFAALLGSPENGRWQLAPAAPITRATRRYREGTLVLETDLATEQGVVTLIDFMPIRGSVSDLVRIVVCRSGRIAMHMELTVRFDYGCCVPWVTRSESGALRAIAGPDMVVLHTKVATHGDGPKTVADFTLSAGESASFVLTYAPSHLPEPKPLDPTQALSDTETFWRDWVNVCTYRGEWPQPVKRSLITLKALTYAPTGGLVAAPTSSLPEWLGSTRNWDYRYCWLRDATLTLLALMDAGYQDEARAWRDWLVRAAAGSPTRIQIMYGLAGERRLPEWEIDWLCGYEGSRPVRIGNAAAGQMQLDVYGEIADALHQARQSGITGHQAGWSLQKGLIENLCDIWQQPDEGIWEVRGGRRHFTHSKVMAWVALDRSIRSAEDFKLEGPLDKWRTLRTRIHEDVCRHGFNQELGAFTQSYGSSTLDASVLFLPLVGFLPPEDPRIRGTIAAIERRLLVDGLVLRYDSAETKDGLPAGEGTFLACSFWLVDNLVLQGRRDEARSLFQRLLELRNDVGLLAEEYDPVARRQLGNFPQALSHLGLVGSALNLARGDKPVEQRGSLVPTAP